MTTILHVTDAAFSGALFAVTDLTREQSARPDTRVAFAYVPRPESPDIARIRALAGPEVRVHRLTTNPRLAVPALLARLRAVVQDEQPDVIHLHSSRTGMIGRFVSLFTGDRRRVVYSPHGFAFERTVSSSRMRGVYTRLERLGAQMAPALALCSPSEQKLAHSALPAAHTTVLSNAVDVERLATLRRSRVSATTRTGVEIAHVGRITEQKLVGMFGRVAERWSQVSDVPARFVWIGDGDRRLLPPSVEITGWLERDELLHRMAATDLVFFTSAGEAMPMALLEAQAMGIPVVASRVTGVVDVVEDGVTGILGDSEDELLAALELFVDSPERRQSAGAAAIARMAALYDMSSLADRSFAAYRNLGIRIPEMEGAA